MKIEQIQKLAEEIKAQLKGKNKEGMHSDLALFFQFHTIEDYHSDWDLNDLPLVLSSQEGELISLKLEKDLLDDGIIVTYEYKVRGIKIYLFSCGEKITWTFPTGTNAREVALDDYEAIYLPTFLAVLENVFKDGWKGFGWGYED